MWEEATVPEEKTNNNKSTRPFERKDPHVPVPRTEPVLNWRKASAFTTESVGQTQVRIYWYDFLDSHTRPCVKNHRYNLDRDRKFRTVCLFHH